MILKWKETTLEVSKGRKIKQRFTASGNCDRVYDIREHRDDTFWAVDLDSVNLNHEWTSDLCMRLAQKHENSQLERE